MKTSLLVLASLLAAGSTCAAAAQDAKAPPAGAARADALQDPAGQAAYAIGLNIGRSLRKDGITVDPGVLARGLQDGFAGAKPALTEDQMRAAVTQLQASVQARQQEKAAQAAQTNKTQAAAFLKANAAKPGVVSLPSGLQYQVLKAGAGPTPKADDTVACNYRGTLIDGAEFDSSDAHGGPASFSVGGVIKGWTEALQRMPVGSKWRLFVPAELAYGDKGAGQDIGPNAALVFDVELLSIQPRA
jgi:FKBP-type peptidyl-prolyl cis-trans isomerase